MAQTAAEDTAAPRKKSAAKASAKAEAGDAAATKKKDPGEAQRQLEAGIKLYQTGKIEPAIQTLSGVVTGGNLPAPLMARALFFRGLAYRKQTKPAQAISDLTSALWLKGGLGEDERADALQNRAAAYREAGLPDQSDGSERKSAAAAGDGRVATASVKAAESGAASRRSQNTAPSSSSDSAAAALAATENGSPPTQTTSNQSSGGVSLGSIFGNLFGGGSSAATASSAATDAAPPPEQPSRPAKATTAWSSTTDTSTQPTRSPKATTTRSAAVTPPETQAASATTAASAGRIRLQLGMVRTREEAQSVAQKARQQLGSEFREPEIDQATVGTMGTFFRVRIGPYASQQEAQALCGKLKGAGIDCLPVAQ